MPARRSLPLALVVALLAPGAAVVTTEPAGAAPSAPSAVSPAPNAAVTLPFQLSWSPASDPSGVFAYNWQVSATSTFAKVLRQDSTMGELRGTVSGLAVGTYFWRVQGVSNDFVQGAWSAPRSVRVTGAGAGLPVTPTLNPPRGGTKFHPWESFGMSWSAVPGAANYILEASKDATFAVSSPVFRYESPTPSTEIMITHVDKGVYQARVFAVSADGLSSMPSNVISFTIAFNAPITAPPTIVSPTGGVTMSMPIPFEWNHVVNPQASGYELQISRNSAFTQIEQDIPQLNGPSYTVIQLPTAGLKYWRVRSFQGTIDTAGTAAATAWSAVGSFTVPDEPVRVSTITLNWPSPASGQEVYVDLQLNRAVPATGGTVKLASSDPSVAPLPASIAVQGSTSWVQFRFWAGQVQAPTPVTMTATIGSISTSHTFTVQPASLKGIEGVPLRKSGGTGLGAIIMLNGQAPAGGATVSLSSSSPAARAPATVTVPAGVESTSFQLTTSEVSQDTPVTITASWRGTTVKASSTLAPKPPPTSLTLDPTTATGSSGSFGRVTAADPRTEDVSYALSTSRPDLVLIPTEVTVPQFAAAGGFNISTVAVSTTTLVDISVTGAGVTRTAVLTLEPFATALQATLSGLSISPASVAAGQTAAGVVTITQPAPAGGAVVSLSSSNTGAATVPTSVKVPAGATTAGFTMTAQSVTSATSVTVSATLGVTRTAAVTVSPGATTDSVTISLASFSGTRLRVEASSSSSTATLKAYVASTGALIGTLNNDGGGRYRADFTVSADPQRITVRSSLGGTVTAPTTG